MQIILHNAEVYEPSMDRLLVNTLRRLSMHNHVQSIDLHLSARVPADAPPHKHPGWLEFVAKIHYDHGGGMTIGCIQRTPEADCEFHS